MAGKKNTAVFGIFKSRAAAEKMCGYVCWRPDSESDDISVLAPDQKATRELATEKKYGKLRKVPPQARRQAAQSEETLGLLAGIGALAISRSGPLSSQPGRLWGALAGAGRRRCSGRTHRRFWWAWGIPEYEAKRYEGRGQRGGGFSCSVHCGQTRIGVDKAKRDPQARRWQKIFHRPAEKGSQ